MSTRSSFDAEKPARRLYRSLKVTKHSTIQYVRYGFLLVFYSNLVRKTTVSEIFDSEKCREIEIRVKMSLKVIETDVDRSTTYDLLLYNVP